MSPIYKRINHQGLRVYVIGIDPPKDKAFRKSQFLHFDNLCVIRHVISSVKKRNIESGCHLVVTSHHLTEASDIVGAEHLSDRPVSS